jgi:arginine-tRNA-protein transferase
MWRFEYFFATDLSARELDEFLSRGWRKFGDYYFRPRCDDCRECIPIRVAVRDYRPSKSQRRTARKCRDVEVRFAELLYRDEIFDIYRDHSMRRFGKESDPNEFITAFYTPSCPCLQSEYYLEDELVAVGFLDRSEEALSSVYFIFKTAHEALGLGTYGAMREIEYAAHLGLGYYYLGYWIRGNGRMAYKGSFRPNERYDWNVEEWRREWESNVP